MRPEIPSIESIRHVHLVAICGTAMGSLACMLVDRGFRVTGSDTDAYPPMSDQLRAAGIEVQKGFAPEHVLSDRPDLVVIGNAVRRENPEARAAIDSGLPYVSFCDAIHHFFLRGKHSVVITGTHGKTTTTSIVAWMLTHAGRDPSALIGGVFANFGGSFRLGEGREFVIEGDEYDTAFFDKTPKFLHYDARTLLVTSVEFDHADIYASLEQIQDAFRALVAQVPSDGVIIAASDADSVREVLAGARARVESYGFRDGAVWRVSDVAFDPEGTQFTVWRRDERVARVRMPMHGRHNVENVLGAIAVCANLGLEPELAARAMTEFRGVKRRQELRGEAAGMAVIDDFAHHPTAVRETIAAIRSRYPDRKLWAILEPRTNTSRRRFFESDFADALATADEVILAGVFRSDALAEDERMRPEKVIERIRAAGKPASYQAEVDEIIEHLVRKRTGRDVALVMSNGGFGGIWERLLARLRQG
ncbi:MAG: UDP-N-acetylmuramate:L-alanyl-gamma-D-glutamyl-meso-diaminopimelate ligase [Deltaproteobacteria bacterium]|nr:UDP-N-acetylmuramate:L-alanyl-gamma-D-glutamyl-meso-diaminopimelate ligase [Deltaproteobacteria bacterium]